MDLPHRFPRLAAVLCCVCFSAAAHADRVVTKEGRVLAPIKARAEGQGYRLVFANGEIVLPDKQGVKAVEVEGDMSEYVPKNDDEAKKLEEGYVRYRSRWLSKAAYENLLRKEHEASKDRADLLATHSEWSNAWTQETKHFVLRSNTSPELLDFYADLLETYYRLMDDRISIKPTPSYRRKKMAVNIYKGHEEFTKLSGARSPSVLGFFNPNNDSLNFFHDYQEPGRSEWVALHECTHLLTYLVDQQYVPQIWINEAVADYFGSSTIEISKKGKIEIEPGRLQTDRVLTVQQAIKDGKDIKLEDLFLITRDNFQGFQYAHAWSFVYFLNNYKKGKYARGFARFFRGLYTLEKGVEFEIIAYGPTGTGKRVTPEDIRSLLLERIGVRNTDDLEKEWKDFITAIPIDAPEARLKRGIRAVYEGRFEAALEDLDVAIEAGVSDPRAFWARARARSFTGQRDAAIKDLEQAVDRDPLNPGFRFEWSLLLAGFRGVGQSKGFESTEAKTQAGLAMELDPENDRYRRWFERFN